MPKNRHELTADRLHELLSYDPETGIFLWKVPARGYRPGDKAGTAHCKGYLTIVVQGQSFLAHRLAWLYVHGRWPTDQIDHRNCSRDDNRIANLREATNAENHQNKLLQKNSTSGHPGISWHSRDCKWHSRIQVSGKRINLGSFARIEDAIAARAKAKAELHKFHPIDQGVAL